MRHDSPRIAAKTKFALLQNVADYLSDDVGKAWRTGEEMKEITLDLEGNPIKSRPKCEHCGKEDWHHKAGTRECPTGRKHRVMVYLSFGPGIFVGKQVKG